MKSELHSRTLAKAVRYAIERKRSEAQLAHEVLRDPLTGIPNRALFLDRIRVALDRAKRSHAAVAVMFLDVDNFKAINDTRGHVAGDRILQGLSERLRALMRPMDTVARFGGDEFTFLFEGLESAQEVILIAERILEATRAPLPMEDGELAVQVSIGIAVVSDPSVGPDAVIREADAAMYRAKARGGGQYEVVEHGTPSEEDDPLELADALEGALERAELRVYYQPKIELGGENKVAGLEALVRWEHPQRGLLDAGDFVALAEEMRLMWPIGEYVISHAVRLLERWGRSREDAAVSVNLSTQQLMDPRFPSMLGEMIRSAGISPSSLCVEVSERTLIEEPAATHDALCSLKAMGLTLAIDDFGTASAAFSNVRRLPVDLLKVHESLIAGLDRDPGDGGVVGAFVELGHTLGLSVVAEGVETESQLAGARSCGFDGAQGFLFGRPMPEEGVEAMLG